MLTNVHWRRVPWWGWVAALLVATLCVAAVQRYVANHSEAVARALPLLQTDLGWTAVVRALMEKPPGRLASHPSRRTYDPLHVRAKNELIHNARARKMYGASKHEERCRELMEGWYGAPFVSVRPDFLRWKTGRNLELDLYNDDLKLAVEYDGIMHRQFHPAFHRTHADFLYQQAKDRWKTERCRELGITLVRVPDTVPFERLDRYLLRQLRRHGFAAPTELPPGPAGG